MTQLTWRPIEAPQGSTRDIAVAGAAIGNSFDRMANHLRQREETLRSDATGAATAEALMAGTPEEIAAIRARGLGGLDKRVDKVAFAKSLGAAETDMLARTKTREEVMNIQAASQLGDEGAAYLGLLNSGDRAGAQALATRMAQEQPDLWGRVAYGYAKDGEPLFDGWAQRTETARANEAGEKLTGRGQDLQHSASMAGVAAQNARTQLEREQINLTRQEKEQRRQDAIYARTFTGALTAKGDAAVSTDDTIRELVKTPTFQKMTIERQDAVLAGLKDPALGRDSRLTPTDEQKEGILPLTNSLGALSNSVKQTDTARLNRFDAQNRPSAVIRKAAELGDVTPDQVYAAAEPRGISKEDIERVRAQNPGVGYNHILASIQNDGSITDSDFFSRKNLLSSDTHWNFISGGERGLHDVAKKVDDLLLNQGDLAASTNARAAVQAPAAEILRQASRLQTQMNQVRAAGGDTSAFAGRIAALEKKAAELQKSLAPAQ